MDTEDDFFKPQSPEEEALFASDKPPVDVINPPIPVKKEEAPVEKKEVSSDSSPEEPVDPDQSPVEPDKPTDPADKTPKQGSNEPDWRYQLRMRIWQGAKEKSAAQTPDEKVAAQKKIEGARRDLAKESRARDYTPTDEDEKALATYTDPNVLETDKQRVRALARQAGFISRDDLQEEVQQIVKGEKQAQVEVKAVDDFFKEGKNAEIYANEENRNVFFDTMEDMFKYEGKSYEQIRLMCKAAHEALFPDDEEPFEDKLAKAATLTDKMKTVQFNGGSGGANAKPKDPETEKLRKEFKDKGEDVDWFLDD